MVGWYTNRAGTETRPYDNGLLLMIEIPHPDRPRYGHTPDYGMLCCAPRVAQDRHGDLPLQRAEGGTHGRPGESSFGFGDFVAALRRGERPRPLRSGGSGRETRRGLAGVVCRVSVRSRLARPLPRLRRFGGGHRS